MFELSPSKSVTPHSSGLEDTVPLAWSPPQVKRNRGPKPDIEGHRRVAGITTQHNGDWQHDDQALEGLCKTLDDAKEPIRKAWAHWTPKPHSWTRAAEYRRDRKST